MATQDKESSGLIGKMQGLFGKRRGSIDQPVAASKNAEATVRSAEIRTSAPLKLHGISGFEGLRLSFHGQILHAAAGQQQYRH